MKGVKNDPFPSMKRKLLRMQPVTRAANRPHHDKTGRLPWHRHRRRRDVGADQEAPGRFDNIQIFDNIQMMDAYFWK
jgi:hypothetical protein